MVLNMKVWIICDYSHLQGTLIPHTFSEKVMSRPKFNDERKTNIMDPSHTTELFPLLCYYSLSHLTVQPALEDNDSQMHLEAFMKIQGACMKRLRQGHWFNRCFLMHSDYIWPTPELELVSNQECFISLNKTCKPCLGKIDLRLT